MSFDFFNEGIKPESAIVFTRDENLFLDSKIPFLDPKKTGGIALGTALQLLKFSGLRSDIYQKILKNCKIQAGTKVLTYDEMKKIFRGIALVQNNIEPSSINLNANIKTKLPVFHEDDSDEEDQPQQREEKPEKQTRPPEKQERVPEKPQQQRLQQLPVHNQQSAQQTVKGHASLPHSKSNKQNKSHQPPLPPQPESDPFNNKLKQFQAYWSKLPTNNNKIDGGQVKALCKNLAQRSNLSKAWKICCLTHSGSLTKGEFFVFLEMVGLTKLPEGLTHELKQIIAQIDKVTQAKPKQKEVVPAKDFSQFGASSQLFQNFGKSQSVLPVESKNLSNAVRGTMLPSLQQTASKVQKSLQKGQKSLVAAQQSTQNEANELRRGQQILNNMMGEIEQFLGQVNSKNGESRTQIDELRNNQNVLNERLNKVCVAMNGIIVKQNSFIDELMQELYTQNALNQQRVTVLENYVTETTSQLQAKQREIVAMKKAQQQQSQNIFKPKVYVQEERGTPEREHKQQYQHEKQQQQEREEEQQHEEEEEQQQEQHYGPHQKGEHEEVIFQSIPQQSNAPAVHQHNSPAQTENNILPINRESISSTQVRQIEQEQNDYISRMKLKQMKVIALINFLTPISAVQYPQIANRIISYSEENLDVAFLGLKQKVQEKQRADQLEMERQQQLQRSSINSQVDNYEFNSQIFRGEDKDAPQQDFFK